MAGDKITVIVRVESGGRTAKVETTKPLVLSGDRRKHRAQLRNLGTEAVAAATVVLGEQFGVDGF